MKKFIWSAFLLAAGLLFSFRTLPVRAGAAIPPRELRHVQKISGRPESPQNTASLASIKLASPAETLLEAGDSNRAVNRNGEPGGSPFQHFCDCRGDACLALLAARTA